MANESKGRIFQPKRRRVLMLAYYGPKKDGRWGEIRESAKTIDPEVAQKRLDLRLRQVKNHQDGTSTFDGPDQRRVTIADLFEDLLTHYRAKRIKGLDQVEFRIRKETPLREFFGAIRVGDLTTRKVKEYVQERRTAGRENATINREIELLRRALRLGMDEGRIVRVAKMPEKLPENNARQGFFEKSDLEALLPHLPEPIDDMVRFAFKSGWRRGELLGLTWESVSKDEVRLGTTKNGNPRSLPLDAELAEIIERCRKAREFVTPAGSALSAYVFHRDGRALNRTVFGKQWRRACIAAKLGSRTEEGEYRGKLFHDLRRTAARNMVRAGVPQTVAMDITGHETDSMFRRYDITDNRDRLKALEAARAYTEAKPAEASNVVPIKNGQQRGR